MKFICSQRSFLLFVAMLAIAVIFNSCRKDLLVQSPDNLKSSLSIAEAKSYFNSHIATKKGKNARTVFSNETTLEEIISNKQPLWDQAYQKMITIGQAVKIPIDFGKAYAVIDSKRNEVVPLGSLNYLFMYKDSLEKVHAEWVVLQPDTTWLYGNRNTYSGRILVRDWNGKPIRNIIYSPSRLSDAGLSFKNRVDGSGKNLLSSESEVDNAVGFCTRFANGRCPKTYPCSNSYCDLCLDICAKLYCNFFDCSPECDLEDNGGGGYTPYPSGAGGGRPSSPGKGDYPPNECDGDGLGALKERFMDEKTMAVRPPCVPKPFVLESIANNIVWTVEEAQFLATHPDIATAINEYLSDNQNSQEAKDFGKWAVENCIRGIPYIVLELIQKQQDIGNYIPRDRMPSSMPMRNALTFPNGEANFSSLNRTTPQYYNVNGQIVANPDAYNCHSYAFGFNDPDGVYDSDNPKWMSNMIIQTKKWDFVTGRVHIGDIIMYFKNNKGKLDWTHSAVVSEVDAEGYAIKAKSKMGEYEVVEHHPVDVTDAFGVPESSFDLGNRRHPSRIYIRKK